ncbi:MAG TPA: oxygenase MpaB family protein [Vicinamibacterales bacterium]|nr:oxygenase MpaB family protein [Vicinamibacterales bacterium]
MIGRRINAERLVLLGWSRAILLQMAHPLIAAGVVDHSHFRSGAREAALRLRGTIRAMLALAFGDPVAYAKSIAGIRSIHTRVHGRLRQPAGVFPAGTLYSAEDPALVLWVHATFLESAVLVYERLIAPVTDADRDRYCDEGAGVAIALGARTHDVPRDWRSLQAYLAAEYASGRIAVGEDAHLIANAVMFPPMSPVTGVPAWINRVITVGLLPEPIRDQYRYRWDARRARQFERTVRSLHAMRVVLPRALAWWPEAR